MFSHAVSVCLRVSEIVMLFNFHSLKINYERKS